MMKDILKSYIVNKKNVGIMKRMNEENIKLMIYKIGKM
jgi:hypothetical protein